MVGKRGGMVGKRSGMVGITDGLNMVGNGSNIGGFTDVGGGDSLTGGDRDEVLDIGTGYLGDDVAVLNLDGDNLDGGVIHAMLGGDITASVLHGGSDRVTNSRSDDGGNGVVGNLGVGVSTMVSGISSMRISVLSISLGISFTLVHSMMGISGMVSFNWSVAKMINGRLAQRHVLNLFGVNGDDVADVLGGGDTVLGDQDIVDGGAHGSGGVVVGDRGDVAITVAEAVAKTVGILGVSVSAGGSLGYSHQEGEGENLSVHDCT